MCKGENRQRSVVGIGKRKRFLDGRIRAEPQKRARI
jgi:hypothetical protein